MKHHKNTPVCIICVLCIVRLGNFLYFSSQPDPYQSKKGHNSWTKTE
jgi:hypothetical protein